MNPVDYDLLSVGPDRWVIDQNAETALAKEDDYTHALTSLRLFVDEVTIQISAHLDRDVDPVDFMPAAMTLIDTDTYAHVATFGLAGWLDDIDWDAPTIERVRDGLSQTGIAGHVQHFEAGLADLIQQAEDHGNAGGDRDTLSQVLTQHEAQSGWINLYCAVDVTHDLSRACADLILRGDRVHHTHLHAIYEVVGHKLAAQNEHDSIEHQTTG